MGVSESLGNIYHSLEEKYYAALDWLDERGIPVYSYNDFIESKGIPGFPFSMALLLVLLALILSLVFVAGSFSTQVQLTINDQDGLAVSQVNVTVKDEQGTKLAPAQVISSGGIVHLDGMRSGQTVVLAINKQGYKPQEVSLTVSAGTMKKELVLIRDVLEVNGKVRLTDRLTGDAVAGARIEASYRTQSRLAVEEKPGLYALTALPASAEIGLKITAEGYDMLSTVEVFSDNQEKAISLSPKLGGQLAGKAKLFVTVRDSDNRPVRNARITLFDSKTNDLLTQADAPEGEYLAQVDLGSSVRLVVEAEGFLAYNSAERGENRTIRKEEDSWTVPLIAGGTTFKVNVTSNNIPLSGAVVGLYTREGELLLEKTTELSGSVLFEGYNYQGDAFVTAYARNYLPVRKPVNLSTTPETTIALTLASPLNSANLAVYVLDPSKKPAAGARVEFFEMVDAHELPTGLPAVTTDLSGYVQAKLVPGTLVRVRARTDTAEGSGETKMEANRLNEITILMEASHHLIEVELLDPSGAPAKGHARVVCGDELVFDGNVDQGAFLLNTRDHSECELVFTDQEGNEFRVPIAIDGQDRLALNIDGSPSVLDEPEISFLGLFNSRDENRTGLTPGNEAYAHFLVRWPAHASAGGVHVRIGDDSIPSVTGQSAGIVGVDGAFDSAFYSTTYTPNPAPGQETTDRKNAGTAGEFNKWVELALSDLPESQVIKVRLRARSLKQDASIPIQFRAWIRSGEAFFRDPIDAALGQSAFVKNKMGLYARTKRAGLKVFESPADCEDGVCASYFFLNADGLLVEPAKFKAGVNQLYALQIELSSDEDQTVTLRLNTPVPNPKFVFTGYDEDDFSDHWTDATPSTGQTNGGTSSGFFNQTGAGTTDAGAATSSGFFNAPPPETRPAGALAGADTNAPNGPSAAGGTTSGLLPANLPSVTPNPSVQPSVSTGYLPALPNTNAAALSQNQTGAKNPLGFADSDNGQNAITIPNLRIGPNATKKVRVYFKTLLVGVAQLNAQLVARAPLTKNLRFEITPERELKVGVSPSATIAPGTAFTLSVADAQTDAPVTQAMITILDSRDATALSLKGTGAKDKGENGEYLFKNTLKMGAYRAQIDAPGYATARLDLAILREGLLKLPPTIAIQIPRNQNEKLQVEELLNTSDVPLSDISYEFIPGGDFPKEFDFFAQLPSNLLARQTGRVETRTRVSIEPESAESFSGEGELVVTATVNQTRSITDVLNAPDTQSAQTNLTTQARSRVVITYNKQLNPECLILRPPQLEISLAGTANAQSAGQFEIENNCDVDLRLEPAIDAVQADPYLQIDAPAVEVRRNQTQPWRVTAYNKTNRSFALQQAFDYRVRLVGDTVEKTASIRVVLWNQNFLVDAPPRMDLFLRPMPVGPYAADTRVLPLFNRGSVPINNFSLAVDDTAYRYRGITAQLQPFGITNDTVMPGQSMNPQRFFSAQTAKNNAIPAPVNGQIFVRGNVAGRQYPLAQITTSVSYPGWSCLRLIAKESLDFVSSAANTGQLVKTVTVQNSCQGGVRVTGVQVEDNAKTKGLAFALAPKGGADVLQPNQSGDYSLSLSKQGDYSGSVKLRARASLVALNTEVISNDVAANVQLGKDSNASGTLGGGKTASAKKKVLVCGSTDSVELSVPAIATPTQSCREAYCDATQFSEQLASEFQSLVTNAKGKIGSATSATGQSASVLGCPNADAYCSFAQMGIKTPTITAYLQADHVTGELLRNVTNKKYPSLAVKEVQDTVVSEDFYQRISRDFGTQRVFLMGQIKGCGVYQLQLDGAYQTRSGRVDPNAYALAVKVVSHQPTPECAFFVNHVANFTPKDADLTVADDSLAWPSSVETDNDALGKQWGNAAFGNDRRFARNVPNNKLKVVYGDVAVNNQTGLFSIVLSGESDPKSPKTVELHVPDVLRTDLAQSTEAQRIAAEIGQTLPRALAFELTAPDVCVDSKTNPKKLLIIKGGPGDSNYAGIKIAGSNIIPLSPTETCQAYTIQSALSDRVALSAEYKDAANTNGIAKCEVRDAGGSKLVDCSGEGAIAKKEIDLKSTNPNALTKDHVVRLCVLGDKGYASVSAGQQIVLRAKSVHSQTEGTLPVTVFACAVHPKTEAVKILVNLPADQAWIRYATIDWNKTGPPSKDKINNNEWRDMLGIGLQAKADNKEYTGTEQKAFTRQILSQRNKAAAAGLVACVVADGMLSGLTKWWMGPFAIGAVAFDALFDCGVPFGLGIAQANGVPLTEYVTWAYRNAWDGIKSIVPSSILSFFGWDEPSFPSIETIQKEIKSAGADQSIVRDPAKAVDAREQIEETVFGTGATESLLRAARLGISGNSANRLLDSVTAGGAADDMARTMGKTFVEKYGTTMTRAQRDAVEKAFVDKVGPKLKEALLEESRTFGRALTIGQAVNNTGAVQRGLERSSVEITNIVKGYTVAGNPVSAEFAEITQLEKRKVQELATGAINKQGVVEGLDDAIGITDQSVGDVVDRTLMDDMQTNARKQTFDQIQSKWNDTLKKSGPEVYERYFDPTDGTLRQEFADKLKSEVDSIKVKREFITAGKAGDVRGYTYKIEGSPKRAAEGFLSKMDADLVTHLESPDGLAKLTTLKKRFGANVLAESGVDTAQLVAKADDPGFWKRLGRALISPRQWLRLGTGVGRALAAEYIGLLVYEKSLPYFNGPSGKVSVATAPQTNKVATTPTDLLPGRTYRFENVLAPDKKNRTIEYKIIENEADRVTMEKELSNGSAQRIESPGNPACFDGRELVWDASNASEVDKYRNRADAPKPPAAPSPASPTAPAQGTQNQIAGQPANSPNAPPRGPAPPASAPQDQKAQALGPIDRTTG